jgi:hypothetical protein
MRKEHIEHGSRKAQPLDIATGNQWTDAAIRRMMRGRDFFPCGLLTGFTFSTRQNAGLAMYKAV